MTTSHVCKGEAVSCTCVRRWRRPRARELNAHPISTQAGMIIDDEINVLLVNPLPPNVRLHAVIDACHSGTAMDLEYR